MENDKFKFFLPVDDIIEKGKTSDGKETMLFKGIASSADKDSQGESLDPSGFDLSSFRWVNWNHLGSKDSATIIGEIVKASINPQNQLYIEGLLYPEVPMAKNTWTLMKALKNSPSGNKLSLSVEGKVTQRGCDPEFLDQEKKIKNPNFSLEKWNKILKSRITGVAICPTPINGSTWVDFLQKGYTEDQEEEFDDETKKAMTAAAGEGVTQKESIEGVTNKVLRKSDIYEKIYEKFPELEIEKSKSVYSLIEKIATMNKENQVTEETITKAFDILDKASEEIVKSENTTDVSKEEEDLKKAQSTYTLMKGEEIDNDIIKSALVKKGYSEDIITKVMVESKENTINGISKAEVENIVKAHMGAFDQKFDAVKTVLKDQIQKNEDLKKSLDSITLENNELKETVEKISKSSNGRKSEVITKSYSDKFEKSDNGSVSTKKFNLNNKTDRFNLKAAIMEMSGINKGEDFDKQLVSIAQDLELTGSIAKSTDISRLQACGFDLVAE